MRKNRPHSLMDKNYGGAYLFIAPAMLAFMIFVFVPVLMTFIYSFFQYDGFNPMRYIGLDNYVRLLHDKIYAKTYVNTFIYIGFTLVLEVTVGLFLAALVSADIKGSIFFRTMFFAPTMLPGVVVGLMWAFVYNQRFGLLNSFLKLLGMGNLARSWLADERTALAAVSIVSGWVFSGYYMTIFYAAMQRIPRELYEAAKLDGANAVTQFFRIKLPLTMDMVQVCVLLCVTGAFQGFDLFYVMTNGQPNYSTEIVPTYLVRTAFNNRNVGYGASLSVVLTVMVLTIALIGNRLRKNHQL